MPLSDTDNSLKAGVRGPTLLQDFHFQQKLTRFDRERIPERVVHARGAAYGDRRAAHLPDGGFGDVRCGLGPGGLQSVETLQKNEEALSFFKEAFKHYKPLAASGEGVELLEQAGLRGIDLSRTDGRTRVQLGVVTSRNTLQIKEFAGAFVDAIKEHRFWMRSQCRRAKSLSTRWPESQFSG